MSRENKKENTMKTYEVPTGHICTMEGEKGKELEFLSIGDYGKEKNLKADFMGLSKEINGVPHGELLSLDKKWVVTISSQYGCSMGCNFCDVPKVGPGINATFHDMLNQIKNALSLHPEQTRSDRLNIHFARMGEPTWNGNVLDVAACLRRNIFDFWEDSIIHPVVSTMMPQSNRHLYSFLKIWLDDIKNKLYEGEAGLQLSINTTDMIIRKETMPHAMQLNSVSAMMANLVRDIGGIKGRKITLNFALTDAEINAVYLRDRFDPDHFICKITPMHKTKACVKEGLLTDDGYDHYYPYKEAEESLKAAGFDVIVFVPSKEEDESRITCGNAILSDK